MVVRVSPACCASEILATPIMPSGRSLSTSVSFPTAVTEYVDELYLCPEFELRRAGTGYRG